MKAVIIALCFIFSIPVYAQRSVQINERIQASYVNTSGIDLARLMTVHPEFEIKNIFINGVSLAAQSSIEFYSEDKFLGRMVFGTTPTQAQLYFPPGLKVGQVKFKSVGGTYIESLQSTILEN